MLSSSLTLPSFLDILRPMQTANTISLRRVTAGRYVTSDGRYEIGQDSSPTECEAPHPDRTVLGGYCYGGVEHDHWYWYVAHNDGHGTGAYIAEDLGTKREAVAYLAAMLSERD